MLVICEQESPDYSKVIDYLKTTFSDDIFLLKSMQDVEHILTSYEEPPEIILYFVFNPNGVKENIQTIHGIVEAKQKLVYSIAILPPELKNKKNVLADTFESIIFLPVDPEEIIKEIQKGRNIIQNFNQQIKSQSTPTQGSSIIMDSGQSVQFFFDTELMGIGKILTQIKDCKDFTKNKYFYDRIKQNIVWPGKTVLRNLQNLHIYYRDLYFDYDATFDSLKAKTIGFVEMKYSNLDFFPAVEIPDDRMKAFAYLFPVEGSDEQASLGVYYDGVRNQGVVQGVFYDAIASNYKNIYREKAIEYVQIAEGKPADHGYQQYIELLVKQEQKAGKIIDKQGTIDFKEHSDLINLRKGEAVGRIIPEKKAVDGFDITGRRFPARIEPKKSFSMGENIVLADNGTDYVTAVEGMLLFEGNTVHCKETLVINGDVNLKTGNIHSNKNLIVKGNVEPGMTVEAKGNIIIRGTTEDAKVVAGGNIEAHGFTGSGKTWVFCKGNITMDFCQNSQIESLGDIVFKKFVVNSRLMTTRKVMGSYKSKIVGGTIESAKGCELYDLGNQQEIPGKVILGVNFYNQKMIAKTIERTNVLKKEKDHLIDVLKYYVDITKPVDKQIEAMHDEDQVIVKQKIAEYKQKVFLIKKLDTALRDLSREIKDEFEAKLMIHNNIYRNVEITIAGVSFMQRETATSVMYYFSPMEAEVIQARI